MKKKQSCFEIFKTWISNAASNKIFLFANMVLYKDVI